MHICFCQNLCKFMIKILSYEVTCKYAIYKNPLRTNQANFHAKIYKPCSFSICAQTFSWYQNLIRLHVLLNGITLGNLILVKRVPYFLNETGWSSQAAASFFTKIRSCTIFRFHRRYVDIMKYQNRVFYNKVLHTVVMKYFQFTFVLRRCKIKQSGGFSIVYFYPSIRSIFHLYI